ncbi:MAG: hypothetical protein K6T31_03515 [Alicyclobacillus sp.]|nr:hypothetical protein [Alicyclobacillus sp.]
MQVDNRRLRRALLLGLAAAAVLAMTAAGVENLRLHRTRSVLLQAQARLRQLQAQEQQLRTTLKQVQDQTAHTPAVPATAEEDSIEQLLLTAASSAGVSLTQLTAQDGSWTPAMLTPGHASGQVAGGTADAVGSRMSGSGTAGVAAGSSALSSLLQTLARVLGKSAAPAWQGRALTLNLVASGDRDKLLHWLDLVQQGPRLALVSQVQWGEYGIGGSQLTLVVVYPYGGTGG